MNYIVKAYDDYDSHRYGTPWAVPCDGSGRPNFKAANVGHFTGGRGKGGNLYVTDPEENSVWAYGQKCYEGAVKASYQFFQFYDGELHPLVPAAVPDAVNEWEKSRKPVTNGDRFRAMCDEALADLLHGFCENAMSCVGCPLYGDDECSCGNVFDKHHWMAYLKSPAKEE